MVFFTKLKQILQVKSLHFTHFNLQSFGLIVEVDSDDVCHVLDWVEWFRCFVLLLGVSLPVDVLAADLGPGGEDEELLRHLALPAPDQGPHRALALLATVGPATARLAGAAFITLIAILIIVLLRKTKGFFMKVVKICRLKRLVFYRGEKT